MSTENLVEPQSPKSPQTPKFERDGLWYSIVILASLMYFGSYYVYDTPAALATEIISLYGIDLLEFNMLYSVYSLPNVILPFVGGYFIDKLGIRGCSIVFSTLVCLGQAIFAISAMLANFPMALAGRFVFGLGAENLIVASSFFTTKWFKDDQMALILAITITFARFGSVLNDWTQPYIVSSSGSVAVGLWVGFVLCVASFGALLILCYLDSKRDKAHGEYRDTLDPVRCSDIKFFDRRFWLLSVNCFFVYICVFPFNNIASAMLQERFGMSPEVGGFIMSITYVTSALLGPFIGKWVDSHGHRAQLIVASSAIITVAQISFVLIPDCSNCYWGVFGFCFLGLGVAIYASVIWPSVPYTVPEQSTGTAFGVVTSFQNTGMFIGPLFVGVIIDSTTLQHGYFWVSITLALCGVLGLITGLALWGVDYSFGNSLSYPNPLIIRKRPSSFSGNSSPVSKEPAAIN